MKIIGWIRRRFSRRMDDQRIDCLARIGNETGVWSFVVVGAVGMRLVGRHVGRLHGIEDTHLLSLESAVDPNRWWKLWYRWNPDADVRWEDGTPVGMPR